MNADLNATFAFDTEGKMTSESYPTDNAGATASLSMSYDTMGRLNTLRDQLTSNNIIASTSYGPANELLSMTAGIYSGNWGSETRTYNAMKQLTLLQTNLLYKDELKILFFMAQIPSDDDAEISIVLEFELKNPEIFDKIVEQFDVFTTYLDSISRM